MQYQPPSPPPIKPSDIYGIDAKNKIESILASKQVEIWAFRPPKENEKYIALPLSVICTCSESHWPVDQPRFIVIDVKPRCSWWE